MLQQQGIVSPCGFQDVLCNHAQNFAFCTYLNLCISMCHGLLQCREVTETSSHCLLCNYMIVIRESHPHTIIEYGIEWALHSLQFLENGLVVRLYINEFQQQQCPSTNTLVLAQHTGQEDHDAETCSTCSDYYTIPQSILLRNKQQIAHVLPSKSTLFQKFSNYIQTATENTANSSILVRSITFT